VSDELDRCIGRAAKAAQVDSIAVAMGRSRIPAAHAARRHAYRFGWVPTAAYLGHHQRTTPDIAALTTVWRCAATTITIFSSVRATPACERHWVQRRRGGSRMG